MTTWILVADEFRARLFTAQAHDGKLDEIADITHPEGRMHDREMTRGHLPTVQESVGNARHAIEPHTTLRDKEAQEFARELSDLLEHGRTTNAYDELMIVATPHFLGMLRSTIGKDVSRLMVKSVGKNATRSTPEEIRNALDDKG
jgi:protein required for attachment to host cells